MQPEIEFPSERHFRRDDWLCACMRPPRAFPRGLRTVLRAIDPSGSAPAGIIELPLACWSDNAAAADRRIANYDANDGGLARCTWQFNTDVDSHVTNAEPLAYTDDDFIAQSIARYVASDGTRWRILFSEQLYTGSEPLPAEAVPALGIARRTLGRPANKIRSIVLKDTATNQCETVERVPLPFFDDFAPQSVHWSPNGFAAGFIDGVWQPRQPAGFQRVSIQTGYGPEARVHRFSGRYGNLLAGMSIGFNNPAFADFYGFRIGPGGGALTVSFGGDFIYLRDVELGEIITGGCGMVYDVETGRATLFFWDVAGEQGSVAIDVALPGWPSWCDLPRFYMASIFPGFVDDILIAGD